MKLAPPMTLTPSYLFFFYKGGEINDFMVFVFLLFFSCFTYERGVICTYIKYFSNIKSMYVHRISLLPMLIK